MRRSYGWKAPRGACLWVNPHMAGTCLPKPVLLRISIARFVSESSHNGGRAHQNRRHRPLHHPVCEPILTRWGSGTPESAPPRISNTRFVSESSHIGTQTTTNHHRRVVAPPTL